MRLKLMSRLVAVVLCFLPVVAVAAPQVCPTKDQGRWIVKSFVLYEGNGVSRKQARAAVGKLVLIDKDRILFAGRFCPIQEREEYPSDYNEVYSRKEYPVTISYTCGNGGVNLVAVFYVDDFLVGRSCGRMTAQYRNALFRLERVKGDR